MVWETDNYQGKKRNGEGEDEQTVHHQTEDAEHHIHQKTDAIENEYGRGCAGRVGSLHKTDGG